MYSCSWYACCHRPVILLVSPSRRLISLTWLQSLDMQEADQEGINSFNKGFSRVKELRAELEGKKVQHTKLTNHFAMDLGGPAVNCVAWLAESSLLQSLKDIGDWSPKQIQKQAITHTLLFGLKFAILDSLPSLQVSNIIGVLELAIAHMLAISGSICVKAPNHGASMFFNCRGKSSIVQSVSPFWGISLTYWISVSPFVWFLFSIYAHTNLPYVVSYASGFTTFLQHFVCTKDLMIQHLQKLAEDCEELANELIINDDEQVWCFFCLLVCILYICKQMGQMLLCLNLEAHTCNHKRPAGNLLLIINPLLPSSRVMLLARESVLIALVVVVVSVGMAKPTQSL